MLCYNPTAAQGQLFFMKIILLKDWDFFPKLDEAVGHFTGRKSTKERLINEIKRKNSGAILISGSRGVGKTALVYESIRNLQKTIRNNKDNILRKSLGLQILRKNSFPYIAIVITTFQVF